MHASCQRNIQRYEGLGDRNFRHILQSCDLRNEREAGRKNPRENVEEMRDDERGDDSGRQGKKKTEENRGITRSEETGNGDERAE